MSGSEKRSITYEDGEDVHSGYLNGYSVDVGVGGGGIESKWGVVVVKRSK